MNDIKVLICSANIGNKAPTQESLWEWIPADGLILKDNVAKMNVAGNNLAVALDDAAHFDIIAIGMQEAAFQVEATQNLSNKIIALCSGIDHPLVVTAAVATVVNTSKAMQGAVNIFDKSIAKVAKSLFSVMGSLDDTKSGFIHDAQEYYGTDTSYLRMLLHERCPSYQLTVNYLRGEMRLIILVHNNVHCEVSQVAHNAENAGIGDVLANKGGIVATLTVRETKLGFVTAHLAAHEGSQHYDRRCKNITDILGTKVGSKPNYHDVSLYAHHTFVFGDLNFRVNLPPEQLTSPLLTSTENQVDFIKKKIEMKDWVYLNKQDELGKALREKECLVGFQTLPCNFPPTFKVMRQEGFAYNPQRLPSYTDRILWKSLDGLDGNIRPLFYHPCSGFMTSDHKPIRGAFSVKPPHATLSIGISKRIQETLPKICFTDHPSSSSSSSSIDGEQRLNLFFAEFSADLSSANNGERKTWNPYIVLMSNPLDVIPPKSRHASALLVTIDEATENQLLSIRKQNQLWPCTAIKNYTVKPSWASDKELHVAFNKTITSIDQLVGAFLYVTFFHADPVGLDHLIGTAVFNLYKMIIEHAEISNKIDIDNEPILKNGRIRGYFSCRVEIRWLAEHRMAAPVT